MQALVTGATGLIGSSLVRLLCQKGHQVRALVRSPSRASALLPPDVALLLGDITRPDSLKPAVEGVDWVFHTAGMPEQWQPDDAIFDRVNRQGTKNVLRAALDAKVARVIYTSTMDVFFAPPGGTLTELRVDPHPKHTAYERSKQAAEQEAERIRSEGLDVVFLNPSAVYGPSPVHIALNSFFIKVLKRQAPLLPPGGMSVVYIDGVAKAHLDAATKGENGARYLLADTFVTNADLAREITGQAGSSRKAPPEAPAWLLKAVASLSAPLARRFGFTPLISSGQLSFLLWSARVDSSKAQQKLGFVPTPLAEGVKKTVAFLKAEGLVP